MPVSYNAQQNPYLGINSLATMHGDAQSSDATHLLAQAIRALVEPGKSPSLTTGCLPHYFGWPRRLHSGPNDTVFGL